MTDKPSPEAISESLHLDVEEERAQAARRFSKALEILHKWAKEDSDPPAQTINKQLDNKRSNEHATDSYVHPSVN